MTLDERLNNLAQDYVTLESLVSKTANVKERVALYRRNMAFDSRVEQKFNVPKASLQPTVDDTRHAHDLLKQKMMQQGRGDLKAKLNNDNLKAKLKSRQ